MVKMDAKLKSRVEWILKTKGVKRLVPFVDEGGRFETYLTYSDNKDYYIGTEHVEDGELRIVCAHPAGIKPPFDLYALIPTLSEWFGLLVLCDEEKGYGDPPFAKAFVYQFAYAKVVIGFFEGIEVQEEEY